VPPTNLLDPPPEAAAFPTETPVVSPVPDERSVFSAWWPLATSWLFMGLELPAVSAALARLPDPTISLAAYGGVIFPLALLIESPIIMLLSASTALSKDLRSHQLVASGHHAEKTERWSGTAAIAGDSEGQTAASGGGSSRSVGGTAPM
jgi:hypothetical protein